MTRIAIRPAGYSGLQKAIHWLTALMVAVLIPVGLYMTRRGAATNFDAVTNQLYTAHKTFGFVLLWLVVLRIVIKARTGTPAPVETLSPLQRLVSDVVHRALYLLLVLVPLTGWAAVSAYPATGALFGLSLPAILPVNQALAGTLFAIHGVLAKVMLVLVLMHVGAAVMHWVILKDGVMRRMLP
jgi:cytochrome b561